MYSIIMMYAVSASTFFFGKQLLVYSSTLFLTGIRTLIAGGIFLLYTWYTGRGSLNSIKKLLLPCVGIAVYLFFLSNTLKFWALQHCSASHAAVISIIEPLFVVIMAFAMFNERMTIQKWIGMALCMTSGLMLALANAPTFNIYDFISVPSLFLCIAVASSAYGALLMRKLIKYENAPAPLVMGMSMAIAGMLALIGTVTEVSSCTVDADSIISFGGNLIVMILVSNIIAYGLYSKLLMRYSALLISCGSFARLIFVALYQIAFFNETLSCEVIGCIVLLAAGLMIIYRDESTGKIIVAEMA